MHNGVLIVETGYTQLLKELDYGVDGHAGHARSAPDGVALYERPHNLNTPFAIQLINRELLA